METDPTQIVTHPSTYTVELHIPEDSDLDEAGERRTIDVRADEYILAAARTAGIWLPADCQQGWCITCAARLLEGEVDHSHARRYYASDAESDWVLPCAARPRSDVVLEIGTYEDLLRHRADHDKPPGRSKLG